MNPTRTRANRIVVSIFAVALLMGLASIGAMSATAENVPITSETSTETLASVSMAESGGRLVLMRFTLEPHAAIRAHSHSGPAVFTVISGALQTELIRGEATINRDGVEEPAEIGEMTYVYGGESIAFAPKAGVTLANQSDEPLLLVASILLESNEPIFAFDYWPPPPPRPHLQ